MERIIKKRYQILDTITPTQMHNLNAGGIYIETEFDTVDLEFPISGTVTYIRQIYNYVTVTTSKQETLLILLFSDIKLIHD